MKSRKVKQVTTVESVRFWYENIKKLIENSKHNIDINLETEDEIYVARVTNEHDVVTVDEKYQKECLEYIKDIGRLGVVLVLDNSDWHPNSIRFCQKQFNWIQVYFYGFGPINDYTWTTTIFINPKRHQELQRYKELRSKCGIRCIADRDN